MKSLKQLYKQEIKNNAKILKEANPLSRKKESLWSKNPDSQEYKDISKRFNELTKNKYLWLIQKETRHLLLAYAKIRNKDLSKVERYYPKGVDQFYLEKIMLKFQEAFDKINEKESSHE